MRILAVYGEDFPWDVRLQKILGGFQADGHEIHLVCRNLARRQLAEVVEGFECRRVISPRVPQVLNTAASVPAFFNPIWTRAITRGIRQARADVVFVRDLPLALAALRAAEAAGLPLLVDMAENHPAMWRTVNKLYPRQVSSRFMKNPAVGRWMERQVVPRADMILCVVPEMREHLLRLGARPERIRVVSNTPELEQVDGPALSQNDYRFPPRSGAYLEIAYVGFVDRSRGLQNILRAMARLGEAHPVPRLHIMGAGDYLRELQELASDLGLSERVFCHGWVDHEHLPSLIRRTDAGVIPHLRTEHTDTTVPNKLFDYMACGLPVLVSDLRPVVRIVNEEKCGIVFRDGDVEEISTAIERLADPVFRATLGRNGRDAILRRYNWGLDMAVAREALAALSQ
jgi:glycosyltransferase involved in cell wall biosynthesis